MLKDPSRKYVAFNPVNLPNRQWPSRQITKPPRWLSTDLRDGNQALIDPMDVEKKQHFFDMLVEIGFKEIEVGFPSASQTDFDFVRRLIAENRVPADLEIQVLTQAREDLIKRTFESLREAPRATVHLYNAISPAFRKIVFDLDRQGVKDIAVAGVSMLREEAEKQPGTVWTYQYSPETFSTTELEFSIEVCEAVLDVLEPTPTRPVILNLPATVEAAGPNVYADQIEWFCRNISRRSSVIISLHPHNDRGTGIAAAEQGLMAGADRVEGCLFANGERTGNVDLVNLALNLYTQGIHPGLDFSDIDRVIQTVCYCTQLPVHPRHPYAGELVFTAFSGSHQDAIKKGFAAQASRNDECWEVPYLPIDPEDLGRSYEAIIRVNSQSGKGGVAWVLEQDKGLKLPKRMQADFSRVVQELADRTSRELTSDDIWGAFKARYRMEGPQRFELVEYQETGSDRRGRHFAGTLHVAGQETRLSGRGNGLMSSVLAALREGCGVELDIVDYSEHAIGHGGQANAAAYVECRTPEGRTAFGAAIHTDVATASVLAILSAANGAA